MLEVRLTELNSPKNLSLLGTFKVLNNLGQRKMARFLRYSRFCLRDFLMPKKILPLKDPLKQRPQTSTIHNHSIKQNIVSFVENGCLYFGHICSKIYFTPKVSAEKNFQNRSAKINCRKSMRFFNYESHCSKKHY